MKKACCILLVLLLLFTASLSARAADQSPGGVIDGVRWVLSDNGRNTYKLTITPNQAAQGTESYGRVGDFDIDADAEVSTAPWMEYLTRLSEIEITEGVTYIGNNAFRSTNVFFESGRMIKLILPNSLREIGSYAFYSVKINNMRLGSGLKTIGDYAFSRTQLTELHLPSVETIGEAAFMDSYYIRNITLGDRLSVIPRHAFEGCTYLREITLSHCITALYGFGNNFQLKDVYYPGTREDFKDVTATYSYYLHNAAFHYLGNNHVTLSTMTPCVGDVMRYTLSGNIAKYPVDSLVPCWQVKRYGTWIDVGQGDSYTVTAADAGWSLRVKITTTSDNEEALSDATKAVSASPACNLTLNIASYLGESDRRTVEIIDPDTFVQLYTDVTDTKSYTINLPDGDYLVRVGKAFHVSREATVTVSGDTAVTIQLHPWGDINGDGKTTVTDYNLAKAHMKGLVYLSGYPLTCADVIGEDDAVTVTDLNMIRGHFKETNPLY